MISKFKQQAKQSPTKTIKKTKRCLKGGGDAAWLCVHVQQRGNTGKNTTHVR